jgi:Zn-dependent alcohol dehydrogenase
VLDSKLDFASDLGATHTINSRTSDLTEELQKVLPRGAEYVFDSVGRSQTVSQAILATAPYGSATVTGMHDALAEMALPVGPLIFQNKQLLGSFVGSSKPLTDLPRYIELYRGGRLELDRLITKRYALEQADQAFADMEEGKVVRGVLAFA